MNSPIFNVHDTLVMLNAYAQHGIEVEIEDVDKVAHRLKLVGCDFKATTALLDSEHGVRPHSPHVLLPVLYSLADLPHLGEETTNCSSPIQVVINMLNFIQRGDQGSGEWPGAVKVVSASDTSLHLAFSTTYQPEQTFSDDDFDDDPGYDDGRGADYEVIIASYGTVHWRNVTADNLDDDTGRTRSWRVAEGSAILEAFDYLRSLHVAVGRMAYVKSNWSDELKGYTQQRCYVRKQVPAQEGEVQP